MVVPQRPFLLSDTYLSAWSNLSQYVGQRTADCGSLSHLCWQSLSLQSVPQTFQSCQFQPFSAMINSATEMLSSTAMSHVAA